MERTQRPDQFVDDAPTAVLVRQILGAVAQFDKAMTVAKLRGARRRKRRKTGGKKVEGRKSLSESRPDAVALARRLSSSARVYRCERYPLSWRLMASPRRGACRIPPRR